MRITRFFAITAGIGLFVPALPIGCYDFAGDCDLALNCPPPSAAVSSSSGGNPDGGTDPSCIPSQAKGPVSETCGIFVTSSQGSDMNTGSKASPVASLAQAIGLAQTGSRRVYACAETFAEAVVVPAGVEIYGGLDCKTGWSYGEASRTAITGAAEQVPLKLSSGVEGTTRLENVAVTAADATILGGSSIAVIADNVAAELTRCDLVTGAGKDGADGLTPTDMPTAGATGLKGANACLAEAMVLGGAGGVTACDSTVSKGGEGGKGGLTAVDSGAGQAGADGVPASPTEGKGGVGAGAANCGSGVMGAEGATGSPGLGGTENGTISIAGFTGASGKEGGTGAPGQGGGGGGGYKSAAVCGNPATMDGSGASGGGGGGGGCGGKGGSGGMAGGSSIGLISLNASLSLTQVTITTGAGGKGGSGEFGQLGAKGGLGGPGGDAPNAGTKSGCKGGDGGDGGGGGPSGGGRGGHSIGIAYQATAPVTESTTVTVGAFGQGGLGVSGNPEGDGAAGMASIDPVEFPAQ